MTKFNKIIATAILFVACNSQVTVAAEATIAPAIEAAVVPAVEAGAKVASEVISKQALVSSAFRSTLTEVSNWCSTKVSDVKAFDIAKSKLFVDTKKFGAESIAAIQANQKTAIAVATAVVAVGICYAICKRHKAKKACQDTCNA